MARPTSPLSAPLASSLERLFPASSTALRLCELNPRGSDPAARALALLQRLNVSSYTVVTCRSAAFSRAPLPSRVRVLNGGAACSVRGAALERALGTCDTTIVGFYGAAEAEADEIRSRQRRNLPRGMTLKKSRRHLSTPKWTPSPRPGSVPLPDETV